MRTNSWLRRLKSRLSLRMMICLSFIAFTLIMAGLLWFFVVFLLERFYYTSKINETQNIAISVMEEYGSPDYNAYLTSIAVNNQTCIEIMDEHGRVLYQKDVMSGSCLLHGMDNSLFYLYSELQNSPNGVICMNVYDEKINMETIVLGVTLGTKDNVQGYLFLNTILEPIDSTVSLLKGLLKAIIGILLVIGCLIALYISNLLAVPIVRLTRSAGRLAKGDLHTKFEGGSYLEVNELAETLTFAGHEISRVDRMQRDLVANISHDLRTPLTMLKAYAEMIRDLSGDNPVKRNAHLQIIIEETDRLTMLVNDILDLSKLQNGSQKLDLHTVNVTEWLNDIITRYKGVSEKMGYHIHFTPDTPCEVTCDPAKLERVVCNLINNAVNYTGDDKNVYVRQVNSEQGIRIEVEDTGQGIPEDKISLIFDKYYRSEHHKREVIGTGLGLSIVKAILQMHGFHFGVHSQLGEGSVFWFQLPKKP